MKPAFALKLFTPPAWLSDFHTDKRSQERVCRHREWNPPEIRLQPKDLLVAASKISRTSSSASKAEPDASSDTPKSVQQPARGTVCTRRWPYFPEKLNLFMTAYTIAFPWSRYTLSRISDFQRIRPVKPHLRNVDASSS